MKWNGCRVRRAWVLVCEHTVGNIVPGPKQYVGAGVPLGSGICWHAPSAQMYSMAVPFGAGMIAWPMADVFVGCGYSPNAITQRPVAGSVLSVATVGATAVPFGITICMLIDVNDPSPPPTQQYGVCACTVTQARVKVGWAAESDLQARAFTPQDGLARVVRTRQPCAALKPPVAPRRIDGIRQSGAGTHRRSCRNDQCEHRCRNLDCLGAVVAEPQERRQQQQWQRGSSPAWCAHAIGRVWRCSL